MGGPAEAVQVNGLLSCRRSGRFGRLPHKPGLLWEGGWYIAGVMKSLPIFLVACLSLASVVSAQTESASPAVPTPAKTTAPAAATSASSGSVRPYLSGWLGDYAGVCAYLEDGSKIVEIPIKVSVQSGSPSRVEVEQFSGPKRIAVTVYVSPEAAKGERMEVTADTMAMSPKYADAVSMDMKRITGGFGGTEALIDGEVKVYQISLNAAPKPVRTYRFRIGPQ